MARRRWLPSQGRMIFLRNYADGIASIDLFVVPRFRFGCCMRSCPATFAAGVFVVGRDGTSKCRMDWPKAGASRCAISLVIAPRFAVFAVEVGTKG